jgi:single-strand DNA-binding protein
MASLNKVILIGNLGKDPEVINFDNGTKKMTVSLATTERYRDRDGNWQEQTEWHNLVSWGTLAQDIADKRRNYVKGDQMYVEGRIRSRQYVDNQNVTRHITEIIVDKMMSLGGNRPQQPQYQQSQYQQQQPQYQPQQQYQAPAEPQMPSQDYNGDDLPF